MVGGDHDLYLGSRFAPPVGSRIVLGFTRGWFTRLAIAAGIALAAQVVAGSARVVASDICQFVVNSTLSKARRTAPRGSCTPCYPALAQPGGQVREPAAPHVDVDVDVRHAPARLRVNVAEAQDPVGGRDLGHGHYLVGGSTEQAFRHTEILEPLRYLQRFFIVTGRRWHHGGKGRDNRRHADN